MATQPHDRRKFKAAMKKPAAPHRFAKRDQKERIDAIQWHQFCLTYRGVG